MRKRKKKEKQIEIENEYPIYKGDNVLFKNKSNEQNPFENEEVFFRK
jgi:hypothetical protein